MANEKKDNPAVGTAKGKKGKKGKSAVGTAKGEIISTVETVEVELKTGATGAWAEEFSAWTVGSFRVDERKGKSPLIKLFPKSGKSKPKLVPLFVFVQLLEAVGFKVVDGVNEVPVNILDSQIIKAVKQDGETFSSISIK